MKAMWVDQYHQEKDAFGHRSPLWGLDLSAIATEDRK